MHNAQCKTFHVPPANSFVLHYLDTTDIQAPKHFTFAKTLMSSRHDKKLLARLHTRAYTFAMLHRGCGCRYKASCLVIECLQSAMKLHTVNIGDLETSL